MLAEFVIEFVERLLSVDRTGTNGAFYLLYILIYLPFSTFFLFTGK